MNKTFLLLCFIFVSLNNYAQSHFLGVTFQGGQSDIGTIFKTDGSGNNETVKYNFSQIEGSKPQYSNVIEATDGKIYGLVHDGGIYGLGVLFQYDPVTSSYSKKVDFDGVAKGSYPAGSLIQANDGMLYGMTSNGGINNYGVLFQFNPITSTFTKKVDFTGLANGSTPFGSLLQASDGKLYGMAYGGGVNNLGTIFQYDLSTSSCTKKIDFASLVNGSYPMGSLIQAMDGMLYGMTKKGGINNIGTIFQFNITSSVCTKKYDFDGIHGSYPNGSLIQLNDGKMYGMTENGGDNDLGTIFQFNPTNALVIKKVDFDETTNGSIPMGSLILANDGKLWGMTSGGGINFAGLLFQYDQVSSELINKCSFTSITGSNPLGSLYQASDGNFYGMTFNGGINDNGTMFQFNPISSKITKKLSFTEAKNGRFPNGSIIQDIDGKMYGITQEGGENNIGTLFSFDPSTSIFTKKIDFDGIFLGKTPEGSLLLASDKKLYGITSTGGTANGGVLYQYDPVTATIVKKVDFVGSTTGSNPRGALIQANDGKLYGMTQNGGANGYGVIYQFDPVNSSITTKFNFSGILDGSNPYGALVQASDGNLYGVTPKGGANDLGTLFQYNIKTASFTKKFDFTGTTNGSYPMGSLIQASDGMIYGLTQNGGTNNLGVLFQYSPTTSVYKKMLDFSGTVNGSFPVGSLIQASNGLLYGITKFGGVNDYGILFEYNPSTLTFAKKLDFNGLNGKSPAFTNLIEVPFTIKTVLSGISICPGTNINVPFTVYGNYNIGNIFTAQLSDATGSFSNPISLGSITSLDSGTILATVPINTPSSSKYRIRVISSNPNIVGADNGNDISMFALPSVTANAPSICLGNTATLNGSNASSYKWSGGVINGVSFVPTATSSYTVTGIDARGCINTATTTVTVNNSSSSIITYTACNSYTYYTKTYTSSGNYIQTIVNHDGCDSVVTLLLTIKYPTTNIITATASKSYTLNSQTYTSSGTYTQILTNSVGCDSIITLHLTIDFSYTILLADSFACNASDYIDVPIVKTKIDTLKNVNGFDIEIAYDKAKVIPTGDVTFGDQLINHFYIGSTSNINTNNSKVTISVFLNGEGGSATFNGIGTIATIKFSKTAQFKAFDSVMFIASVTENFINTTAIKKVKSGIYKTFKDKRFKGSLSYWDDNSPIVGGLGHLATNISSGSSISQPDANGEFSILNQNDTITIVRDINSKTDVMPVVNGYDALLTARVAVEDPTFLPSIYQIIAMDVNMDGVISAGDISQINRRTVKSTDYYTQIGNLKKDWMFVDKATISSNNKYQISKIYPLSDGVGYSKTAVPSIPPLFNLVKSSSGCSETTASFIGILIGDINGNYKNLSTNNIADFSSLKTLEIASKSNESQTVIFDYVNAKAVTIDGIKYLDVPVIVNSVSTVSSLDFKLQYDKDSLQFESIINTNPLIKILSNENNSDSILRFTSYSFNGFDTNKTIISVRFKYIKDIAPTIGINATVSYLNGELVKSMVTSSSVTNFDSQFLPLYIYPNPTKDILHIIVPQTSSIVLYNTQSQVVSTIEIAFPSQIYSINTSSLAKGIYYLKVTDANNAITKVIIVE